MMLPKTKDWKIIGAVDLEACPDYPGKCKCDLCKCGERKHMAIHGPLFGQKPGTKPWGHEFSPFNPETAQRLELSKVEG